MKVSINSELDGVMDALAACVIKRRMPFNSVLQLLKNRCLAYAAEELHSRGEKATVSRLSVVTGLNRKDVASLLGRGADYVVSQSDGIHGLAQEIINRWTVDGDFLTPSGRPRRLSLDAGEPLGFRELVSRASGDINYLPVLRELESLGLVRRENSMALLVRRKAQKSRRLFSENPAVTILDGVVRLIDKPTTARFINAYGERAMSLLDSVDAWKKTVGDTAEDESTTVKLGFYLIELPKGPEIRKVVGGRRLIRPSKPGAKSSRRSSSAGPT
jgi:Family of unknown function (DUF6502)